MLQSITGVIPIEVYNSCLRKDDVITFEKLCKLQPFNWSEVSLKRIPVQCLVYYYTTEKESFEKLDKLTVNDKNYIKWLIKLDEKFKQQGIHDFIKNPLLRKCGAKKYIKHQIPDVKKISSYFSIAEK